ncbi:hypothetical protein L9G16_09000 [Shewanella sp. A25]|nr:hypothetical protein [Shewanella shenzhenensis]
MEETKTLYQLVFKTANYFLEQAKLFSIAELKEHNDPTYDELAKYAHKVAAIIGRLADLGEWEESRIALNARQAALYMESMAIAISLENADALEEATSKLDAMTFI